MDPAGIGALIGIGVMICIVCSAVAHEKGSEYLNILKEKYQKYRHQRQPLLPVVKENPVLLRSNSKQFQMKEILPSR